MSLLHEPGDICFSEYAVPQEAKVDTTLDPFCSPWPWCPYRSRPHDTHTTNEGNTTCAGVPGVKPVMTRFRLTELRDYWQKSVKDNLARAASAHRRAAEASLHAVTYQTALDRNYGGDQ